MDFTKIDRLRAHLKTLRPLNKTELKRLRDEFIIENTYDSNAIEGSTLTLQETALILQEGLTIAEKPIKEHLEAIGHKDAFEYIITLAGKETPISERIIREIHSLVLMNDAANRGIYRRVPVRILGASHIPPEPHQVPEQMQALLSDYEKEKSRRHIIEAAAEFHLRFEGIHPFIDGNGRTGRLILNLELMKAGMLPVNIKFTDRRRYYDSFESYYSGQDHAAAFTEMLAEYETEELKRHIKILEGAKG